MPAIGRKRSGSKKRKETPYSRPPKQVVDKQHNNDKVAIQQAAEEQPTLFNKAAKQLVSFVSWVFHQAEDLPKTVRQNANTFHREPQSKSELSQLEEGTLHAGETDNDEEDELSYRHAPRRPPGQGKQLQQAGHPKRQVSLLSNDLAPHYLGKTPKNGKSTKQEKQQAQQEPRYQVSRFDSGSFKIPQLPTPVQDRTAQALPDQHAALNISSLAMVSASQSQSGNGMRMASWTSTESQGRKATKLDPLRWQTQTGTGIMAAMRELRDQQTTALQQSALALPTATGRGRSTYRESSATASEPMWHKNIFFSQRTDENMLDSTSQPDREAQQAAATRVENRYWGPVRHFPRDEPASTSQQSGQPEDLKRLVQSAMKRPSRRQSQRQPSRSRPSTSPHDQRRQQRAQTPSQTRASRQATPRSVASSAGRRRVSRSREQSLARQPEKPDMVDSQVQTAEVELMQLDPILRIPTPPTLSKERRKRAGCFSALDEDMEDLFGPYSDVPAKKAKLSQEEAEEQLLERPKVPLLRETDDVVQLRAQQQREMDKAQQNKQANGLDGGQRSAEQTSGPKHSFAFGKPAEASSSTENNPAPEQNKAPSFNFAPSSMPISTPSFSFKAPEKPAENNKPSSIQSSESTKPAEDAEKVSASESQQKAPASGFNFAPAPSAVDNAVPKFSFGATAPSTASSMLGASKAADDASSGAKPSVPAFNFSAPSTAPVSSDSKSSTTPVFVFGQTSAAPAASSTAADKPTPSGAFDTSIFGGKKNDSADASKQPSVPNFSFTSSAKPAASLASADQQPAKPAFNLNASAAFAPAAAASAPSAETTAPVSLFPSKPAEKPASSGFSLAGFGSQPENTSTTPIFSFGSTAVPVPSKPDTQTGANAQKGALNIASSTQQTQPAAPASTGFSFGNTTTAQPAAKPNAFGSITASTTFGNGTSSAPPAFGTSANNTAPAFGSVATNATPAFGATTNSAAPGFGAASNSNPTPFGSTDAAKQAGQPAAAVGFPAAPASNASRASTPVFGFGAPAGTAPSGAQQTNAFGSQPPSSAGSIFGGAAAAASNSAHQQPSASMTTVPTPAFGGFGAQTAAQSTAPFGTTQPVQTDINKPAPSGFGAAAPTTGFGFGAQTQTNTAPSSSHSNAPFNLGAPSNPPAASTGNTGFPFGASNTNTGAAPALSGFGFGNTNPGTQPAPVAAPTAFAFGQNTAQQAPAMVFGGGGSAQAFSFGGTATAPGSGLVSAAPSPVLTAPGSPNPFAFNAGAAGNVGAGSRKIAQPRSRRKK